MGNVETMDGKVQNTIPLHYGHSNCNSMPLDNIILNNSTAHSLVDSASLNSAPAENRENYLIPLAQIHKKDHKNQSSTFGYSPQSSPSQNLSSLSNKIEKTVKIQEISQQEKTLISLCLLQLDSVNPKSDLLSSKGSILSEKTKDEFGNQTKPVEITVKNTSYMEVCSLGSILIDTFQYKNRIDSTSGQSSQTIPKPPSPEKVESNNFKIVQQILGKLCGLEDVISKLDSHARGIDSRLDMMEEKLNAKYNDYVADNPSITSSCEDSSGVLW